MGRQKISEDKEFSIDDIVNAMEQLKLKSEPAESVTPYSEVLLHAKSYSDILDEYQNNLKAGMKCKRFLKKIFFWVTLAILVAMVVTFIASLIFSCYYMFVVVNDFSQITLEVVLSFISVQVSSVSSLIVAFLKLPKIIAEYLFDPKEDSYMADVVKNTQVYDQALLKASEKVDHVLDVEGATSQDDNIYKYERKETAATINLQ